MRILILAALLLPGFAQAQVIAGSNSESSSASQSASGAQSNNANNVNIISSVPETQRHESTATESVNVTGQQHIKTNTGVGLAAAVSFSSDYCGGTVSGGASAAGITIGGAKPVFDSNCQKLRGSEGNWRGSFNAKQMGMHSLAAKLAYLAVWENCTRNPDVQAACYELGLIRNDGMVNVQQPEPVLP